MHIRIVTDSTCDLPKEIVNQQAITVIPLHINVGDKTYLDGIDLSRSEFYAQLPHFSPAPKTSAPGPEVFAQAYEQLADQGAQAILSIHISESLSATINSARIAAEQFTAFPSPCSIRASSVWARASLLKGPRNWRRSAKRWTGSCLPCRT